MTALGPILVSLKSTKIVEGWIKQHRIIMNHWIYPKNRPFTEYEAWCDLLLLANHKEKKFRVKNKMLLCKRGETIRSISGWAGRWGWSKSKIYRFLKLLESDTMIEMTSETVTTRISICNYDIYQSGVSSSETQTKLKRNASETTPDSNKNVKKDKNDKKEEGSKIPSLLEVQEYFELNGYKKEIAERAFNLYNTSVEDNPRLKYWRDSKGNQVKNWKMKMQSVWFKEESLSTPIDSFNPEHAKRLYGGDR